MESFVVVFIFEIRKLVNKRQFCDTYLVKFTDAVDADEYYSESRNDGGTREKHEQPVHLKNSSH